MIGEVRTGIQSALEQAGLKVHPYLPARITPPIAVINAGSPYVVPGDTFGTFTIRHTITVIVPNKTNEVATRELDQMIEDSLVELVNGNSKFEQAGQPYALEANNAVYAAADLTITTNVRI